MIQIEQIKKNFDQLQVLDGVSLSIDKPGIFAVLGPNGSGKTTLLKSILGMVLPQQGDIQLNGVSTLRAWKYRNQIGYLPQIARFPDNLTVQEVIEMIKSIREQASNENPLLDRFGMWSFMNKKLGNLSGGTRQKVNLVLTFMFDCELYILDEPTAGLDPVALIQLKELIQEEKAKGKTFLITTHIMNLVEELSDEIVFLLDGKIYFKGSLDQLKKETKQTDLEHAIAQILK
ncbi:MAG: ABC transporter ATP-binding protein [Reichenbachiella sp.]|uniref:ABC transporter ATP-binding protein n=1 Tax=Reichenbachiella sp. TaxID=2184521 RepID=UPI0032981D79